MSIRIHTSLSLLKMLITFKTTQGVYMIIFMVHIFIALILQMLYVISDDGSIRKKKFRYWLLYITPFYPDVKNIANIYINYLVGCGSLAILQYLNQIYLNDNRLHILYQLQNPTLGKLARDERINYYIDTLIISNQTNSAKLSGKNLKDRLTLIRLKQERSFLMSLKLHKDSLVPGITNRYNMRKKFLYITIIVILYNYIVSMILTFISYKKIKSISKGQVLAPTFLSTKLFIDYYFVTMFYGHEFSLLLTSNLISMLHYKDMLRSLIFLISLLGNNHYKRDIDLKRSDLSEDLLRIGSDLNSLALIGYIRLRYILDSTVMGLMNLNVNFVCIVWLPNTIYNNFFNPHQSKNFAVVIFSGPLSIWNLTLLGSAHVYTQFSLQLRRILSLISNLIYRSRGRSNFRGATTSHTKSLWMRLIPDEKRLTDVFAVHLLNLFKLNYDLWLTMEYYTHLIKLLNKKL